MRRLLTVVLPDGTEDDIALTAPESVTVGEIAWRFCEEWGDPRPPLPKAANGRPRGGDLPPPPLTVDGERLSADTTLADSPLRDGARVGFGGLLPLPDPWEVDLELRIIAGEDAGTVLPHHRLESVFDTFGDRLPWAAEGLRLPALPEGPLLVRQVGRIPVTLQERPVTEWTSWPEDEPLTVGRQVLVHGRPAAPAAPGADLTVPGPAGTLLFDRRPRPPVRPYPFEAGRSPALRVTPRPAAAGERGRPGDRATLRWSRPVVLLKALRLLFGVFDEAEVNAVKVVRRYALELRRRRGWDPVALLSIAEGRTQRLWERRPGDDDFLALECGPLLGSPQGAYDVAIGSTGLSTQVPAAVLDVLPPLRARLPDLGCLGIAGPGARPRRLAARLVAQAAVLHSPEDVSVQVFTDPEDSEALAAWHWLRWLPRSSARPEERDAPRVFAADAAQAWQVNRLLALVAERRQGIRYSGAARGPDIVLVLEGARRRRTLPGVAALLRDGPQVGIHVICLESETRLLPAECVAVLDLERNEFRALTGEPRPVAFLPDMVPQPWFERLGRALAPLRDAATEQRTRDLAAPTLLELIGLEPPDAAGIAVRWQAVPRSTTVALGQAAGQPFEIDLVRDGPHALVAGTSGSGRSEVLRVLIASLAVANRPDEMQFVLVDYKGGGAFGPLAGLPHVTSLLTDLDSRQTNRILGRLAAALRDREALLSAHRVKDFAEYQDLRDRRRELPPLPRLVLVVDDFAALGRELPDLVTGLTATAQRGRSLGVHLVLATQRASGAVTADIRAATNLRIALRASGPAESDDVIDAPDAAHLSPSTPGRALVRTGARDLVEMQTARLGGPVAAAGVDVVPLGTDGSVPPRPASGADGAETDLFALVRALRQTAIDLDVPALPGPLPPLLATVVPLDTIPKPAGGRDLAPVAYGWEQAADELTPQPALFDLVNTASLSAEGPRGSGRSQFLRTIAAALAERHSTADVHLFGIDCGDGALQALTGLPHCGAVAARNEPDRIVRLLGRLNATVYARRQVLATGGFADLAAQRQAVPAAQRLPYLVLLVDRWEELPETRTASPATDVLELLSHGAGAGVRLVLTSGSGGRAARLPTDLVRERLVLGLTGTDAEEVEEYGFDPALLPDTPTPGRAFRPGGDAEIQIALLDAGTTRRGQTDALDRLAGRLRDRDAHVPETRRPFRVEDTPRAADQFIVGAGAGTGRPVGREDVLAWLRDRYASGTSVALLGPRRAGKTWVLEELNRRLVADGFQAVRQLVLPQPRRIVEHPDELAGILDPSVRGEKYPAEALLEKAGTGTGTERLMFLLDEVGRLAGYAPAAVSWLRDLGQAGAWLVYTGTEKDWRNVVRWALSVPGSSFGNDINARPLGPLKPDDALDFLTGTAANLRVNLPRDTTAARIVEYVGTWPFYLQAVGDAVVRAVQGDDLEPLTRPRALRDLVTHRLLDEWSHHFRARWAEIGPAGRAALLAAPGSLPLDASPAQRQELREVGLLGHGDEWLHDPPLLDWIARNENSLSDGELPG
ncbi:FtsK/SpoIIIE domain-containing protein [Streptomyces sp. ITFR-21]|nr:FtsK/SpoIIIE domain-containing protein [Streptomyces sp. ITFR-21]WNI19852.1 FtsK/SpoIIIE domain-containing protein [Streptomyces sp. ITFR-21]